MLTEEIDELAVRPRFELQRPPADIRLTLRDDLRLGVGFGLQVVQHRLDILGDLGSS